MHALANREQFIPWTISIHNLLRKRHCYPSTPRKSF